MGHGVEGRRIGRYVIWGKARTAIANCREDFADLYFGRFMNEMYGFRDGKSSYQVVTKLKDSNRDCLKEKRCIFWIYIENASDVVGLYHMTLARCECQSR